MADNRQREIKRVVSGWLTEELNALGRHAPNQEFEAFKARVRSIVLERIDSRLAEINF